VRRSGWLRYGKKDGGTDFFSNYLLPECWQGVGPDLYDALRNGIAHGYETKTIRLAGRSIEVGISWRKKPHLSFDEDEGQKMICVNIRELAAHLGRALDRYEAELGECAELRDRFHRCWRKGRCIENARVPAWQKLIAVT
jgi:hypothetical protein